MLISGRISTGRMWRPLPISPPTTCPSSSASKRGMNLREYINQIRIEEAKRLLLTTNLSVSEVAGMSGYENISYFSTVFRKYTGMSPIDWRNLEISNGETV